MAYTDLITSEHQGKPKFEAMVAAVTDCMASGQAAMEGLVDEFDLDNAVGVQLDAVGKWVGLSRYIPTALPNVYFSFDIAGLGLDEGYIKGPYDPDQGVTRLDDDLYRMALRVKIGANHWDGTIGGLDAILNMPFDGSTTVFAQDFQDMSMAFYLLGVVPPPVVISLLTGGYLSVKPAG